MRETPNRMRFFVRTIAISLAFCLAPIALTAHAQQTGSGNAAQAPEVQQMQKLEDQWSIAAVNHDQYQMDLLLSPLYVGISSSGEVSTRNQQIATMFERTGPQLLSMEQRVVSVRLLGDVALVQGTYILKHRTNGKTVEDRGIFTHVFERSRSTWVCVNSQRTPVVEPADANPKAASGSKPSNAALPFHIPLLHKGAESTPAVQPPQ